MPTYDYVCQACGHALEIFQSMSEAPKKKCPACGKSRLQRQIGSGAGIIFKGSGFYETDYRSDSYKQAAKKESAGGKSASESDSSGSSGSKDSKGPPSKDSKGAKGSGGAGGDSGPSAKTGTD